MVTRDSEAVLPGEITTLSTHPALPLASIAPQTQKLVLRMFADPNLLEKPERAELVETLRSLVKKHPHLSELRVLFGMALCVDFDAQAAIEELREAVRLNPNSYISQLKMGELWMRLRVIDKAEEHTRQAGLLAQNAIQMELARKQASSIRTMKREGIERGGYKIPWTAITRLFRRPWVSRPDGDTVALEVN